MVKQWFGTPIYNDILINIDAKTLDLFDKIVLDGGSFGFETNSLGGHYLAKNVDSGKLNFFTKLKTIIKFVFPSPDYVRKYYYYSVKHPVLIPLAYINRIFDAVFKRGKHSRNTFGQILSGNEISQIQSDLIKELDL